MSTIGRFRVEPRLIHVLGSQYHSTEDALKELVANAWDADATWVDIQLPTPVTPEAIVIRDNGYGMTRRQVEGEYLHIAYDRRKQGQETPKGRKVRGFRGVGKFAGLITAGSMSVTTIARGIQTCFSLNRELIENQSEDIAQAQIVLEETRDVEGCGTVIRLEGLLQNFSAPTPEKLGRILIREFGRNDDFQIKINEVLLTPAVVEGRRIDSAFTTDDGRTIIGTVWISDKVRAVADPGIIVRVNGRGVGPPTFFGLEDDPDIPKSLLSRLSGELHADHLVDDVTANWAGLIENSDGYRIFAESARNWLREKLLGLHSEQTGREPEDFVDHYSEQIALLPPTRRELARRELFRLFKRFYDEAPEKRHAIAEFVLNAFEQSDYWFLVERIDATPTNDISVLVDILRQWGLTEIGEIAARAHRRLSAIDAFERLASDAATLELEGVHKALQSNVWILGDEYELLTANRTLRQVIEKFAEKKYRGDRASERPDLFLAGIDQKYLLVELKRPSHRIGRGDVAQALQYRDELLEYLPGSEVQVMVVGGRADRGLRDDDYRGVRIETFIEVILRARSRLKWLIENLVPQEETENDPSNPPQ